ncbi:hypothetical protein HYW11_00160 [Candidatus Peregrinibacteria bacterium]|nr:hypothetical protein [Candidatus Peregrinibacteria bacterium]
MYSFRELFGEANFFSDLCAEEVAELFPQFFIECLGKVPVTTHVVRMYGDGIRWMTSVVHITRRAENPQEFLCGLHADLGKTLFGNGQRTEGAHEGGEFVRNGRKRRMEAVPLVVFAEAERCAEFLLHRTEPFGMVSPDFSLQCGDHVAAGLCCHAAEGLDGEDRDGSDVRGIGDNVRNHDVVFFCGCG